MSDREPDIELPPPLQDAPGMPRRISAKERAAVLVWLAVSGYFLYVMLTG